MRYWGEESFGGGKKGALGRGKSNLSFGGGVLPHREDFIREAQDRKQSLQEPYGKRTSSKAFAPFLLRGTKKNLRRLEKSCRG